MMPRYAKRGRPATTIPPTTSVYQIEGALASSLPRHNALVVQHRCLLLATNELDETALSAQALLDGDTGQHHAERGCRFLQDPLCLAAALSRKQPERIMALLMVMTICVLVYAALEYRIRQALKAQQATFPNQKGQPVQNPTARWIFQYFVGIHLLWRPGEWPQVLNLTEQHLRLLQLLGVPYERFYS